jgi:hypothetical protein
MMNSYSKYLLVFVLALFVVGCGYKEGVVQKDSVAHLWFTGSTEQAYVFVDDKEAFVLNSSGGKLTYYQIAPGKHKIVVKKGNEVVVDRIIIVSDGAIKEIQIP